MSALRSLPPTALEFEAKKRALAIVGDMAEA